MVSLLDDYIHEVSRRQAERDEATVRELLGRWVSELEPSVAYDQQGNVIGLSQADAPVGSGPFILRVSKPSKSWTLGEHRD